MPWKGFRRNALWQSLCRLLHSESPFFRPAAWLRFLHRKSSTRRYKRMSLQPRKARGEGSLLLERSPDEPIQVRFLLENGAAIHKPSRERPKVPELSELH